MKHKYFMVKEKGEDQGRVNYTCMLTYLNRKK